MPLREYGCVCGSLKEIYHPAVDPTKVPTPVCSCGASMKMLFSVPNLDTTDSFKPIPELRNWRGPDGKRHDITNLYKLRQVEKSYQAGGYDARFDAYSAEPSNPNAIDGFGLEPWDGKETTTKGTAFGMPTMEN